MRFVFGVVDRVTDGAGNRRGVTASRMRPALTPSPRHPSGGVVDRRRVVRGRLIAASARCEGQASIELVAMIPLVVMLCASIMVLLAGRTAHAQAEAASREGAAAIIQERDPRAAARKSLPKAVRRRSKIMISGRSVTVTIEPRTPIAYMSELLTASVTSHAGRKP